MMSSDEEEYCTDDSNHGDPMTSEPAYRESFLKLVKEFFGLDFTKRSNTFYPPGFDHEEFKKKVAQIIEPFDETEYFVVFSHVICNQYAEATGNKERNWETHDQMASFYKKKRLPRTPVSTSSNLIKPAFLDGLSDDDEEEEEEEEEQQENTEKMIRMETVLDDLGIGVLRDVACMSETVMQRSWIHKKKTEPKECTSKSKTYDVYEYPDNEETRELMMESIKLALFKLSIKAAKRSADNLICAPPKKKARSVSSKEEEKTVKSPVTPVSTMDGASYAPSFNYGTGYTGFEGEGKSDDRVYWGDIIQDVGIEEMLIGIPNSDEMLKEIKMTCGRNFVKRFKGPERNPVSGRREYTTVHKPNMIVVAEEMKRSVGQNLKRSS